MTLPGPRKAFIKSYGCQMNVYDAERMSEALAADGYVATTEIAEADLVVLNTCHIREKAAEKVYSELGRIREMKTERRIAGRETVVVVAGCVAQAEGSLVLDRAPAVDVVVGPQGYQRLPALVQRARLGRERLVETELTGEDKFTRLPEREGPRAASAFLTVQEGCDKFCTFCVVPYTRGAEFSRPVADVVGEARTLVARGAREITLLGQNVNAYHGEGPEGRPWRLAALIERLAGIEGLDRLRYTTSHPRDMTRDLILAHRDIPKLMPYLHLPFQAGADRILAAMNRQHTIAEYREMVDRVREARADIALSTDIIVGFPGETDADFQETLDVVEQAGFAHAYAFTYSTRPGTPAANRDGQVPEAVKKERLAILRGMLDCEQTGYNGRSVGRTLPVLLERRGRQLGQVIGRSPYLQSVVVESCDDAVGSIVPVAIRSAGPNSLWGVIEKAYEKA